MPDPTALQGADFLLGQRRTRAARELLAPLIEENPDSPEVHLRLARAAIIDENNDLAREHLDLVLARAPNDEIARWLLAHVEYEEKNYPQAEALIIELIRENPRDAEYLAFYARLLLVTLHLDKARRLATEAIRIDPTSHDALVVSGLISVVDGRATDTDETIRELIESDPEGEQVLRLLFFVLSERKLHREALRVGQRLLQLNPGDGAVIEALVEMRYLSHWTTLPLYPLIRWGWSGSAALWLGFLLVMATMKGHPLAGPISLFYLFYVLYSWLYPPLLKRYLTRRGL